MSEYGRLKCEVVENDLRVKRLMRDEMRVVHIAFPELYFGIEILKDVVDVAQHVPDVDNDLFQDKRVRFIMCGSINFCFEISDLFIIVKSFGKGSAGLHGDANAFNFADDLFQYGDGGDCELSGVRAGVCLDGAGAGEVDAVLRVLPV